MNTASRVLGRYLSAKFKAPRKGFPPEYSKAGEVITGMIEARGHDLTQWQQLGGKSGWFANCVRCGCSPRLHIDEDGTGWSEDSYGGLAVRVPNSHEYQKCEPEAQELVRGMGIMFPDGIETLLQQSPATITSTIIEAISKRGIGASWTVPTNIQVAINYSKHGAWKHPDKVLRVVLHAEFHRSDQKRNYKPAGFVTLEGFEHEEEVFMNSKEVLRLKQIDWYDGQAWRSAKVSVKAIAGNWGRDPRE